MASGSLAQFKGLLQRRKELASQRREKFDKNKLDYDTIFPKASYTFPEPTEFELQKIKDKIREDKRRERLNHYFMLLVAFVLIGFFLAWLFS